MFRSLHQAAKGAGRIQILAATKPALLNCRHHQRGPGLAGLGGDGTVETGLIAEVGTGRSSRWLTRSATPATKKAPSSTPSGPNEI